MAKKEKKEKKKKEKITYIDDGSTVVDMSYFGGKPPKPKNEDHSVSRARRIFNTYIDTMKFMLLPMIVMLIIIALSFLIVWLIL